MIIKGLRESGEIFECKGQGQKPILNDCDLQALRRRSNKTVRFLLLQSQKQRKRNLYKQDLVRAVRLYVVSVSCKMDRGKVFKPSFKTTQW